MPTTLAVASVPSYQRAKAWTSITVYVIIIHFCLCILICTSALFLVTRTLDDLTATKLAASRCATSPASTTLHRGDVEERQAVRARTHRTTANRLVSK
jgi:hypothetical protein